MVIVLHGLTDRPMPPDAPARFAGAPLDVVACGSLSAVTSGHERVPTTVEAALAHAELLAGLGRRIPLLPVRFGAAHPDRDALRTAVVEAEVTLTAALERVGGRVEFVVRPVDAAGAGTGPAAVGSDPPATGENGRGYLERRLREEQRRQRDRAELEDELAAVTDGLLRDAVEVLDLRGRRGPERCFLVEDEAAEAFAHLARPLLPSSFLLGGPWPPFTFAAAAAAPVGAP